MRHTEVFSDVEGQRSLWETQLGQIIGDIKANIESVK